ncbi:MAG: hypothetical protein ACRD1X_13550 [Vicinamibacteria bacterium]
MTRRARKAEVTLSEAELRFMVRVLDERAARARYKSDERDEHVAAKKLADRLFAAIPADTDKRPTHSNPSNRRGGVGDGR